MEINFIKNDAEYQHYLDWVDEQFNNKIPPNSENGKILEHVLCLIKNYEDAHYPIPTLEHINHEQTSNS
jgi:HTH-type transcriptional regulator/antitoxin HigA